MANRNFRRQEQMARSFPAGAGAGTGVGTGIGFRPQSGQQSNLPYQPTPGSIPGLGFGGGSPQFGIGAGYQTPGPISPQAFSQMSPQQQFLSQQGFYQQAPGGSYFTAGSGTGGGAGRVIGAGSQFNTSGLNTSALNAYYQNPFARQFMDQLGMTPSYTGVNISGPSGNTYGRTGGANPQSLSGQSAGGIGFSPFLGGAAPGSAGTFRGPGGIEIDRQTGLAADHFRPGGAGFRSPATAGLGGTSSNFSGPGRNLSQFGSPGFSLPRVSAGGGGGLLGSLERGLTQEMDNPTGLPTQQLRAESADAIGRSTARGADEVRESFARRGQSGTEAERAALRELEESGQRERRTDIRDIAQRDALTKLQRRLQALGTSANFLRGERSDALGLLQSLIGGL